jgi:AcrR family transcriptional regulator
VSTGIRKKRAYRSELREQAAQDTRNRVLAAAKALFGRRGIDAVTIDQIAERAGVSASTIYGQFKSKDGILQAVMKTVLFGGRYQEALRKLEGELDPVRLIALTAGVARAIYEAESVELGLIRGASAFSPALRKLEQQFEEMRFVMQEDRLKRLYACSKGKKGLPMAKARRILWMYTSRDIYRMLVHQSGWTPNDYEDWLSCTLVEALVET